MLPDGSVKLAQAKTTPRSLDYETEGNYLSESLTQTKAALVGCLQSWSKTIVRLWWCWCPSRGRADALLLILLQDLAYNYALVVPVCETHEFRIVVTQDTSITDGRGITDVAKGGGQQVRFGLRQVCGSFYSRG